MISNYIEHFPTHILRVHLNIQTNILGYNRVQLDIVQISIIYTTIDRFYNQRNTFIVIRTNKNSDSNSTYKTNMYVR